VIDLLVAAGDAGWEPGLIAAFDRGDLGVRVARRCLDVADLLAAASAGQGSAAVVDAGLRRLDRDALARLSARGVTVVGLLRDGDADTEQRWQRLEAGPLLPAGADPGRIVAAVRSGPRPVASRHDHADPLPPAPAAPAGPSDRPAAHVVAVWGPTGAPGRTTVAVGVAAELAVAGHRVLLVDADPYGGCVAQVLGLQEESPGLAAAARAATAGVLDAPGLGALCRDLLTPAGLLVLPGIVRAERWPELRPSSVAAVLATAAELADVVVVDTGFCLELDEELSFDTIAPRRNGATLEVLDAAHTLLAVGSADPVGLTRLVRALPALPREPRVVLNRVRGRGRDATEVLAVHTGLAPVAMLPLDPETCERAVGAGRSLAECAPRSDLRRAMARLAARLPVRG